MTATPEQDTAEDRTGAGGAAGTAERTYDVVVLGAGAVGENVADRAGRDGLSVVVVESELVGGECSYWACMPSKALLRPGGVLEAARAVPGASAAVDGGLDVAAVLARRDAMTSHWDDDGQVRWLDGAGIALVRGEARFTGPRRLEVRDADTGHDDDARRAPRGRRRDRQRAGGPRRPRPGRASTPGRRARRPPCERVPASLAIIGGGVVAAEMATAYADLGCRVTVVVRGERLLPSAEPFAGEAVTASLLEPRRRPAVRHPGRAREPRRRRRPPRAVRAAGRCDAEEVLVATGRRPRTARPGAGDARPRARGGRWRSTTASRSPPSTTAGCSPPGTSPAGSRPRTRASTTRGSRATSSRPASRPTAARPSAAPADGTVRDGPRGRGAGTGRPPTTRRCRRSCSPGPRSPASGSPRPRPARPATRCAW